MAMRKFTETHEWVRVEDEIATVGVTHHAQEELGDIVYVELPEVGESVKKGEEVAVLESTKAAADVYPPVSGEIVAVNEALEDDSSLVNQSAESEGYLLKIKLSDPSELDGLLTEDEYKKLIGG